MIYPIAIHKDPDSCFGVVIPDLPGCFSAGDTLSQAIANARIAALVWMETMVEDRFPIPDPSPHEDRANDPDYKGAIWAVIEIDTQDLPTKSVRINISVPEHLLGKIDQYAKQTHQTRSGVLVGATVKEIELASATKTRRR